MSRPTIISDNAEECRETFKRAMSLPRLMNNEWAENVFADFNLWSASAGTFARGKASLDARLASEPEALDIIANLLRMLKVLLEKCIDNAQVLDHGHPSTLGSLRRRSFHNEPEYAPKSQMVLSVSEKDAMEDSESILREIVRVTVAVRKAGAHSRRHKADKAFNIDSPTLRTLRRHLEIVLQARGSLESAPLVYPSQNGSLIMTSVSHNGKPMMDECRPSLGMIQSRLIESNLIRRNRFLYSQQHSKSLAEVPAGDSTEKSLLPPRPGASYLKSTVSSRHEGITLQGAIPKLVVEAARSTSTATAVETKIILSEEQHIESAMTAITSTTSRMTYPRPPTMRDGQNCFICPCCCQTLPSIIARGNKWKKHIVEDIIPYTCILEECPRPLEFYINRQSWLDHMNEDHKSIKSWTCFACDNTLRPVFQDESKFVDHVHGKHQPKIKSSQIPMLVSAWYRSAPVKIDKCPLCHMEDTDRGALLTHIANEIHAFSLRSLPWGPPEGVSDSDDGGNYEDHFKKNPYFEDAWKSGSSHSSIQDSTTSSLAMSKFEDLPPLDFGDNDSPDTDNMSPGTQLTETLIESIISQENLDLSRWLYSAGDDTNMDASETPTELLGGLWADALTQLKSDERRVIEYVSFNRVLIRPAAENLIDELLILAQKVKDLCEQKNSRYRRQDGEVLALRDVANNIVLWINQLKEIGIAARNYDSAHAALPLTGVFVLLEATLFGEDTKPALVGEDSMTDQVLVIEMLSFMITRGTIYEYLRPDILRPTRITENKLRDQLTQMYAEILQTIAQSSQLVFKTGIEPFPRPLSNSDEVDKCLRRFKQLGRHIELDNSYLQLIRSPEADGERRKLLGILRNSHNSGDAGLAALSVNLDDSELRDILDWTSPISYWAHHHAVRASRTAGTCEWLFDHSTYCEWGEGSASSLVWLFGTGQLTRSFWHGKSKLLTTLGAAGTGKTFLVSRVIDDIGLTISEKSLEGFAFFYFNRNENQRRHGLPALQCLVRQLSNITGMPGSIRKEVKEYYDASRLPGHGLSITCCKKILRELILANTKTTIVLDGLDECEYSDKLELVELLQSILMETSLSVLKILISSRPDGGIKDKLSNYASIRITTANSQQDISHFINIEISKHRCWSEMSQDLQNEIIERLESGAEGMFLWAYLQIKQLLELSRPEDIKRRLGKLPIDLKSAYDNIMERIPEHEKELFHRAIRWVMCAREPLSTREILPAVCQDWQSNALAPLNGLDEDMLLEFCHNLLVIDPVHNVWVPSHHSVLEYFECHVSSISDANHWVTNVCLLLLQNAVAYNRELAWFVNRSARSELQGRNDPLDRKSFKYLSFYARQNWSFHAKQLIDRTHQDSAGLRISNFLGQPTDSSAAYRCWHRMYTKENIRNHNYVFTSNTRPLSYACFAFCYLGLEPLLPNWQNYEWASDSLSTESGMSLLELASLGGEIGACQNLIAHGANVNLQTTSDYGSALCSASSFGRQEIIKLLIQAGVVINMQLQSGQYGNALAAACFRGSRETVKLLIDAGADVDMQLQSGKYGSALTAASVHGERETVKLLIDAGADVDMQLQSGIYGSALAAASVHGKRESVKLLIDASADVNMQLQSGTYGSALAAACFEDARGKIVRLLLGAGADVNMVLKQGTYGNALAAACFQGSKEVVRLLLEAGADINMQLQSGKYGTALAAALSNRGGTEIVELVIQAGADVNMQLQSVYPRSALVAACVQGRKEIVELLLQAGANVNLMSYGKDYESALAAAILSPARNREIMKRIIEAGADMNSVMESPGVPTGLEIARSLTEENEDERQWKKWVIELLIEAGAVEKPEQ